MPKRPVYKTDEIHEFEPIKRARIVKTDTRAKKPRVGQKLSTKGVKSEPVRFISHSTIHPKRGPGMRFSFHTPTAIYSVEMTENEWQRVDEWIGSCCWGTIDGWITDEAAREYQKRRAEMKARLKAQEPDRLARIARRTKRAQRMWWRQFTGLGLKPLSADELDFVKAYARGV